MRLKICNTCRASSKIGVDLLDIHICKDCLEVIGELEIGDKNYDYYKETLGKSWNSYLKSKAN